VIIITSLLSLSWVLRLSSYPWWSQSTQSRWMVHDVHVTELTVRQLNWLYDVECIMTCVVKIVLMCVCAVRLWWAVVTSVQLAGGLWSCQALCQHGPHSLLPGKIQCLVRSTPLSWPNKVVLKCPSARPCVRPSTKTLFDFNEIWYIGRDRWVMHDGMLYDPIQGQGQGHELLKVGKSAIFKGYLLPHLQWGWQMTTDS